MVKVSVLNGTFELATELLTTPSAVDVQGLSFLTALRLSWLRPFLTGLRLSWLRLELLDDPPAVDRCVLQPGDGSASPCHQPHHTYTKKKRFNYEQKKRKIKRMHH